MQASFSSTPKIKIFSSVDGKYFIGLLVFTTIAFSASYFLKSRVKNKNEYK
jgi:hypothetical protein